MPGILPVCLLQVTPEHEDRKEEEQLQSHIDQYWSQVQHTQTDAYHTVIERIPDPLPKCSGREELVVLSELIQLWIPVEHSGRHELVEDTDDERGKDGEENVVE